MPQSESLFGSGNLTKDEYKSDRSENFVLSRYAADSVSTARDDERANSFSRQQELYGHLDNLSLKSGASRKQYSDSNSDDEMKANSSKTRYTVNSLLANEGQRNGDSDSETASTFNKR